jgi:hypothetical protein
MLLTQNLQAQPSHNTDELVVEIFILYYLVMWYAIIVSHLLIQSADPDRLNHSTPEDSVIDI